MIVQNRIEGTRITVWDVLHYLTESGLQPVEASGIHPRTRKRFPRL
jgi:hypothetical protein